MANKARKCLALLIASALPWALSGCSPKRSGAIGVMKSAEGSARVVLATCGDIIDTARLFVATDGGRELIDEWKISVPAPPKLVEWNMAGDPENPSVARSGGSSRATPSGDSEVMLLEGFGRRGDIMALEAEFSRDDIRRLSKGEVLATIQTPSGPAYGVATLEEFLQGACG